MKIVYLINEGIVGEWAMMPITIRAFKTQEAAENFIKTFENKNGTHLWVEPMEVEE